jgi:rubrerythrin
MNGVNVMSNNEKLKREVEKMKRLNNILWKCNSCDYKWKGDDLEEECPICKNENIIVSGK